jgi:hypothetical protein
MIIILFNDFIFEHHYLYIANTLSGSEIVMGVGQVWLQ